MPTEQGLWLNNEESVLPSPNCFCQKHQDEPIRFGTEWSFDLWAQDNELLAHEGVLGNQFGFSAGKIRDRPEQL